MINILTISNNNMFVLMTFFFSVYLQLDNLKIKFHCTVETNLTLKLTKSTLN